MNDRRLSTHDFLARAHHVELRTITLLPSGIRNSLVGGMRKRPKEEVSGLVWNPGAISVALYRNSDTYLAQCLPSPPTTSTTRLHRVLV
jgi:hypothetical protein